jgi:UDP-N-acetylmuramate: L-alanyl-gamma-D-glutamyl-meso-diaminopimelate ligase
MKQFNDDSKTPHLYFMGICGTAMASVAAAFRDAGYRVTGSDSAVYDPMKTFLESRDITILDGYKAENLPEDVDFFVIGNAQSRGNPEVEAVLNQKLPFISMPQLLREQILQGKRNLIVSGTHGKTTTASMLAWLLESSGRNPGFVIGGIPGNFKQGARFTNSEFNVVEGDEYDSAFFDKRSKFIHYHPEVAIINNMEFDHADIFDNLTAIRRTFGHMVRLVPENGLVVLNGDDQNCVEVFQAEGHAPGCKVGFGESCDKKIGDVQYHPHSSTFIIDGEQFEIPLNGEYNVRNAAMASVAAAFVGVTPEQIRAGLKSFIGVKRRQEIRGVTSRNITIVDDFGHHPTAIKETITGMRRRFEGARLWAVFEPGSNTMKRKVFQDELPLALAKADAICLAQVARAEKLPPDQRLDPEAVVAVIKSLGKPAFYGASVDAIVDHLKSEANDNDVIIVFSNGGFGGIHEKLLKAL